MNCSATFEWGLRLTASLAHFQVKMFCARPAYSDPIQTSDTRQR
jgi:hypothetical protein